MKNLRVNDAPLSVARAAEKGEHKGWSTFDSKLEGARFHMLHQAVSGPAFDAVESSRLLDELETLAQSYGYGQADSYLTDAHGLSGEEIEAKPHLAIQRDSLFADDGEEDPYFVEVRTSERLLLAAAATPEAEAFLGRADHGDGWAGMWGPVHVRMQEAFRRGRDMREAQSFSSPSP